jgi:holo-[acyl-carrier protein] synthase
MVIGIGIDMIEVARVGEKASKENGFRQKVFSERECAFCESRTDKDQYYASRFAAKEAFLKATGKGLTIGYELHDIEVVSDSLGKPGIILHGNFETLARENGWNKIHLSLSHVQAMACAVVIIEA